MWASVYACWQRNVRKAFVAAFRFGALVAATQSAALVAATPREVGIFQREHPQTPTDRHAFMHETLTRLLTRSLLVVCLSLDGRQTTSSSSSCAQAVELGVFIWAQPIIVDVRFRNSTLVFDLHFEVNVAIVAFETQDGPQAAKTDTSL